MGRSNSSAPKKLGTQEKSGTKFKISIPSVLRSSGASASKRDHDRRTDHKDRHGDVSSRDSSPLSLPASGGGNFKGTRYTRSPSPLMSRRGVKMTAGRGRHPAADSSQGVVVDRRAKYDVILGELAPRGSSRSKRDGAPSGGEVIEVPHDAPLANPTVSFMIV